MLSRTIRCCKILKYITILKKMHFYQSLFGSSVPLSKCTENMKLLIILCLLVEYQIPIIMSQSSPEVIEIICSWLCVRTKNLWKAGMNVQVYHSVPPHTWNHLTFTELKFCKLVMAEHFCELKFRIFFHYFLLKYT